MRRYVIEVPDNMVRTAHPQTGASVISGPGMALVQNGMHGWLGFIPDAYVVDAETVPDPLPLPTEPGVRFWGRRGDDDPQWWFISDNETVGLLYVPTVGVSLVAGGVRAGEIVRLPDPEATS